MILKYWIFPSIQKHRFNIFSLALSIWQNSACLWGSKSFFMAFGEGNQRWKPISRSLPKSRISYHFLVLNNYISPGANLGYRVAPTHTHQDNFSWVPKCSLWYPRCETRPSSKTNLFGICEKSSHSRSEDGVCLQNYSYLSCYIS